MLVLSRDCDTVIRIGPDIKVKVLSIRKQRVKLGVDAPSNVRVWRDEIVPELPHVLEDSVQAPSQGNRVSTEELFPVLVVEDDPEHARLIAKVLSDCRIPQVTVANSGAAAIKALGGGTRPHAVQRPYLVLLDLNLPDISGLEVLRKIRSDVRLRTMPVVILSAQQEEAMVADCLEAGANAFVNKSTQFQEFREAVSRIANFWRSDCRLPRTTVASSA